MKGLSEHYPRELPLRGELARLAARASALRPWPTDERSVLWMATQQRHTRRQRRAKMVRTLAFLPAAALALLVSVWPRPTPVTDALPAPEWTAAELAGIGRLEAAGTPELKVEELAAERRVKLASGRLRASILPQDAARPVVIVTPHVRVVVIGTSFAVEVGEHTSTVEVFEGKVRVEAAGAAVSLAAGERIRSDDQRLTARPAHSLPLPAPDPTLPAPSGAPPPALDGAPLPARAAPKAALSANTARFTQCSQEPSLDQRKRCFETLTRGLGLPAQNALYALGLLARDVEDDVEATLRYWAEYQRRFPDGFLAPEVSLGILGELVRTGRVDEALAAATAFEQRFPSDARRLEVRLLRAKVLCTRADQRAEALRIIEELVGASPPGPLRAAVEGAREACETDGASEPWRQHPFDTSGEHRPDP